MFFENRNTGTFTEINVIKDTIERANSVPFSFILNYYGLDTSLKKMCCPLHNDNTPSFFIYEQTNSFHCFGCKVGGGCVDFVSQYEDISRYPAAIKIINEFPDCHSQGVNLSFNYELNKLCLEFSSNIRNFKYKHNLDYKFIDFAEEISKIFDSLKARYEFDVNMMEKLVNKMSQKLKEFECQQF